MLKEMLALSDKGARDLKKGIAATAAAHLCVMLPVSLLMTMTMALIDKTVGRGSAESNIPFILLLCAFLTALIFVTQWVQYNLTYKVAYEESAERRMSLAEKMRRLPLSFFGQRDLSDLITTMMGDCSKLERMFSNAVPGFLGTVIMFIIISCGLLVIDWRMGLCIILPVPISALVVLAAQKKQIKAEERNLDAHRAAYDSVQEYLDVMKELRSDGLEKAYLEDVDKKLEHVVSCAFQNELAPGIAVTLAQFFLRFGIVAVLLAGGLMVADGSLSVTMFILYLVMAGRVYEPFGSSFMLMAEMISSLVSIKRTKQMEAIKEQGGQPVCNNQGYDIEFQDVVFTYHADLEDTAVSGRHGERVLNGVSFVAKQGEITALVGPSGGGKSTVSRLAARFWDADSGRVLLGGVDVTTVEPETLFKNYSIVFQEVTLFDQSVMENIRLGRQNATDEEVLAAASAAQCEEFVSRLPEGYQSNIGENGCILSGGERQRISIARAILKDAPVVILDEATASMDAENETLVQQALSELLQGKTVLVIAHRMRTIANADKVVVLDHGQVVEMGTPTELLEENGLFQRLVAAQGGHL